MYRFIVLVVLALASTSVAAQVSLSALDVAVTQDFNALPASGTITVSNNVTPIPGWYYARTGTGMTMVADAGAGTGGNLYSYGTAGQTDRALGSLGSGNAAAGNFFWGVRLLNNTGSTITSLDVSFTGEQWRNGAAAAQTIAFSYFVGSPTVAGSLAEFQTAGTSVAALDFTGPITGGAAAALNGNLAANRAALSATISGLSIPNGSEIMLRWSDPDHPGADHGLSIDDFSVIPRGAPGCTVDPVVTSTADSGPGSLRNAVATACANSTITFLPAAFSTPQTITLTSGEIVFPVNLTVTGPGAQRLTISGNNASRIFYTGIYQVSIASIRFIAGNGVGAIYSGDGHVVLSLGGNLVISDAVFTGNAGTSGAVIDAAIGTVSITRSEFTNNIGGGNVILMQDVDATITDCLVFGNDSQSAPIYSFVANSTNRTMTISNSTISGNASNVDASALWVRTLSTGIPTLILRNNTITGNTISAGHPAIRTEAPTITRLTNSIVVGNTANGGAADIDATLDPISSHNLIGVGGGLTDGVNNNMVGLALADALVSPLGDHGGPLRTHALLPGSPAIDAGLAVAAPTHDTRGVTRPQLGGVDIGSFETRGFNLSLAGGSTQTAIIDTAFALPLTVSVAAVDATDPVDGGQILFTTPSSGASAGLATSPATINAGSAQVTATANSVVGSYSVAATAVGYSGAPIPFALINGALQSDLAITKTDGVTSVTAGGSTTYTITASNAGPSNATGATISDSLPASLTCTWTCVGAGGGTCTAAGSGNINDTVNLPAGGSTTYTASCSINPGATGTLSNTATVTAPGGVTDPAPGNNSATDSNAISRSANLGITKTDGVTSVTAGGSTTYTITASNAGPSNATGATVADTLPASLTCTWTCVGAGGGTCTSTGSGNIVDTVNLPAGGSTTYTASCSISASATGTLSNTATVTAPAGVTDPTPGNNSATDSNTIGGSADLSITKTDGVTSVTAGGSTIYTITASNAGPSNASGATVADTLPASLTCTWTCVGAGGGTCTSAGSGNIADTVNLPAGGSTTHTASCSISGSATGTLSNTATVTAPASVTDPTPGNNSATDSNTIGNSADLSITKTDGVTNVTAGGSTIYTITASNAGPSNATGATVADMLPASLTCTWACVGAGGGTCTPAGSGNIADTVNLPVGGSTTHTASCSISGSATGTLSNTATVTAPAGVTDPTPGNNSATDSNTIGNSADLSITKTDGVTSVNAGSSTTYTITASNAGPSNATGATVADTFPAACVSPTWTCVGAGGGTCTSTGSGNINSTVNLPSGGSVTYAAICPIDASATGTLSNTATVTAPAGVTDPTPGNNSATDSNAISAAGAIQFSSANYTVSEDDGSATITVSTGTPLSAAASLDYASSNGTAESGSDYTATSGTLNFVAGDTSRSFTVPITDDAMVEGDETITLTLSGATGAALLGAQSTAVLTITNDDATAITISAPSVVEGNAGSTAMTFEVSLSNPVQGDVSFSYATADGSATSAGNDYVATNGSITFASGSTASQTIVVAITGDTTVEPDETLLLNLSDLVLPTDLAAGSITIPANSTGTIVNDDGLSISVVGDSAPEGTTTGGVLTFTISLSQVAKVPVNLDYATSNGTAMSGTDFIGVSGTLAFAPGEMSKTVLVDIIPDSVSEGNETVLMTLSNPQPADVTVLGTATAYATIINDDVAVQLPINNWRAMLLMLLLIGGFGGLALRRR